MDWIIVRTHVHFFRPLPLAKKERRKMLGRDEILPTRHLAKIAKNIFFFFAKQTSRGCKITPCHDFFFLLITRTHGQKSCDPSPFWQLFLPSLRGSRTYQFEKLFCFFFTNPYVASSRISSKNDLSSTSMQNSWRQKTVGTIN